MRNTINLIPGASKTFEVIISGLDDITGVIMSIGNYDFDGVFDTDRYVFELKSSDTIKLIGALPLSLSIDSTTKGTIKYNAVDYIIAKPSNSDNFTELTTEVISSIITVTYSETEAEVGSLVYEVIKGADGSLVVSLEEPQDPSTGASWFDIN